MFRETIGRGEEEVDTGDGRVARREKLGGIRATKASRKLLWNLCVAFASKPPTINALLRKRIRGAEENGGRKCQGWSDVRFRGAKDRRNVPRKLT